MINNNHPAAKDLTEVEINALNILHTVRDLITIAADKDPIVANELYPLWLLNERTLQALWGFKPDVNYIRTWRYPHCTCPKMDNDDAYPTGHYVTDSECPIHGD